MGKFKDEGNILVSNQSNNVLVNYNFKAPLKRRFCYFNSTSKLNFSTPLFTFIITLFPISFDQINFLASFILFILISSIDSIISPTFIISFKTLTIYFPRFHTILNLYKYELYP